MVLSRELERTLRMMQGYVTKLQAWGMPSCFAYFDRSGGFHSYGQPAITDVLQNNVTEIYTNIKAYRRAENANSASSDVSEYGREIKKRLNLPSKLMLPRLTKEKLDTRSFHQNKELAVYCIKSSMGGTKRRIGWGLPEVKPPWWPEHVPWTKRGVQSGVHHPQLKEVIMACYRHHGCAMPDDNYDNERPANNPTSANEDTPGTSDLVHVIKPLNDNPDEILLEATPKTEYVIVKSEIHNQSESLSNATPGAQFVHVIKPEKETTSSNQLDATSLDKLFEHVIKKENDVQREISEGQVPTNPKLFHVIAPTPVASSLTTVTASSISAPAPHTVTPNTAVPASTGVRIPTFIAPTAAASRSFLASRTVSESSTVPTSTSVQIPLVIATASPASSSKTVPASRSLLASRTVSDSSTFPTSKTFQMPLVIASACPASSSRTVPDSISVQIPFFKPSTSPASSSRSVPASRTGLDFSMDPVATSVRLPFDIDSDFLGPVTKRPKKYLEID